jgi:hypothetical protein
MFGPVLLWMLSLLVLYFPLEGGILVSGGSTGRCRTATSLAFSELQLLQMKQTCRASLENSRSMTVDDDDFPLAHRPWKDLPNCYPLNQRLHF